MWILRYLILASRQRSNAMLDRRTRMTFDPLHGCAMYVCRDKADWDQRGKDQVAQLDSELRQDIEAYNTVTGERRVIAGETIEVRPVVLETAGTLNGERSTLNLEMEKMEEAAVECEEPILPEDAPEMEAAPVSTGDAPVSSGVEAQAEAEPGADPTLLTDAGPEEPGERTERTQGTERTAEEKRTEPLAVPTATTPTEPATPKPKTKPAGKAGKK